MASLTISPPLLWTAGTIWPPVCIAIVAARLATRKAQGAKFGPDDWLILPALAIVLGMAAMILAGVAQHGLGYPTPVPAPGTALWATSPQQTVTRKAYWAGTLLQTAALAFTKLSCMFFYQRIFRTSRLTINMTIWTMNVLIFIWGVGFFFAFLFSCGSHFDYFWTSVENQLKCHADLSMMTLSLSISDVIMDVMILAFPIPLVLRLQMSIANKLAVLGIFVIGALAIAMSSTRLAIIVRELNAEFAATADEDMVSTSGLYFMYLEACFALVAVCLPSLSGALKLKGVQNMVDGFSQALSNLSRSSLRSVRSRSSKTSKKGSQRPGSLHSERSNPPPIQGYTSYDIDLEENPLPEKTPMAKSKGV